MKGRNFDYPKPVRGRMAKAALWQMEEDAKLLRQALRDDDSLPGWVDLYLATSADRLNTASQYMQYQIKFQSSSSADLDQAATELGWPSLTDIPGYSTVSSYVSSGASSAQTAAGQAAAKATQAAQEAAAKYLPAELAQSVGAKQPPSAYESIPPEYAMCPTSTAMAYHIALFWLNFAIERSNYDSNKTAAGQLTGSYRALYNEAPSITEQLSLKDMICSSIGLGCKTKGRAEVLGYAYNAISASTLSQSDKDKILPILNSSWRTVKIKEAVPFILVGGGAAAGVWWWQHKRA